MGKGINDYNPREKPILWITSEIKKKRRIEIKNYIALKKPILLITLKIEKIK